MTYFHRTILPILLLPSIVLTQKKHALMGHAKRDGTCQAKTNANIGSATETLTGFADIVKLAYQSVRPEQQATLTLVEFRRLLGAEHNMYLSLC
mmetsp:Transcript_53414/g.86492  ORF Transcript_53414/g.86492 Transcript_53414/m.86492 type:complete len:94 (+) Transcript_53414:713-994(+)